MARIELLLSGPLGFPCHVKAMCLAKKKKGINHGLWEFEKHIGNIKKKTWKEKIERFLGSINIVVEVKGICMIDSFNYFFSREFFYCEFYCVCANSFDQFCVRSLRKYGHLAKFSQMKLNIS